MDTRKLDTGQVLAAGVLNITAPESSVPEGFEGWSVEEFGWSDENLRSGLEQGGLTASMYYGCWDIWEIGDRFDGQLLQYRSVTDSFSGEDIDFALEKAIEWAEGCQA